MLPKDVKMNFIKTTGMFVFIAVLFLMNPCAKATDAKKIGVLLWSNETRYTVCKNAIMDQLRK